MLNFDDDQISISIDLDQGARLASLQWRDLEFVTPFNGDILRWGWYSMAPWAGRILNGTVKDTTGKIFQLPTTFDPPNAIHGFGFYSSWQDLGDGKQLLEFPYPYTGASVVQRFEILGDAIRWSLEYEANDCDLPFSLGFHPCIARNIDRGDSAEVLFAANKMLVRGNDFIPTGELISQPPQPWDDTFIEIMGQPEVVWPGAARLTIESDTPYWHVFTGHQDFISLEPVTAPPNAQLLDITGESYIEALFTFREDFL